ncbi:MAG: SDR family oxidoreductase [Terricaulis sp.]
MATFVVTGANRGIGLELVTQLKARGDDVIAVCRTSSTELDKLGVRVEQGIDVSAAADVAELAKRLAGLKIDVLINNAGIGVFDGFANLQFDAALRQFEVNALAPLRLSATLAPQIPAGGKAIFTSRMGSMADNGSGGYYGYRMSKAAVNAAGVSLARDLRDKQIAVTLIHPGMVATDMTGRNGIPAEESVRGILARIDALQLETSGLFVHAQTGEPLPW